MTSAAIDSATARAISFGPWLWGPRLDLALFVGSAAMALSIVGVGHWLGLDAQPFPEWGWLIFVLGIDVAHVYSTLFRTYLDGAELRRHPWRYGLVPLAVFLVGLALYSLSSLTFWRVFAYVAVFHFIRQQVGWVAIYRAKSEHRGWLDRSLDELAVYAATLYPLVYWHAHLETTEFAWFVKGDFVDLGAQSRRLLPWFEAIWYLALAAFLIRQLTLAIGNRTVQLGKLGVVGSTVAIWYVGIVATNNDFAFTVTNVIVHGVPYAALLWMYARARAHEQRRGFVTGLVARGLPFFVLFLVGLGFVEELLWDQLVFHERAWLFGTQGVELPSTLVAVVVALLMVPQATHYVLDGLIWRRAETRRSSAQRRALGFRDAKQEETG